MAFDLGLTLFTEGGTLTQARQVESLLECNAATASYGLQLTPAQAQALLDTRSGALRKTGRVELSGGILEQLILTFCDSPYLTRDNYEETLHTLVDLFYHFKNETEDRVGDAALLTYMKRAFDGQCRGSLELLAGTALPEMARKLRERCASPLPRQEVTDD